MKLKVVKQFHDKETDTVRKAGEVIEVSDKRGAEILASKANVAELLKVMNADNGAAEIYPAETPAEPAKPKQHRSRKHK